jgi:hypothetical protein
MLKKSSIGSKPGSKRKISNPENTTCQSHTIMEAISEARRHIDNAKDFLSSNAKKQDGLYQDKKYVKIAGHTAYTGILLVLNELLGEKNKKTPKSVEWYQFELSRIDKTLLSKFTTAYEILHIDMGYQGIKSAETASLGLRTAEKIIDWVETRLEKKKTSNPESTPYK